MVDNRKYPGSQQFREITTVVDHLFRHESGKIISTLTRIFGKEHISMAEDVVQEALVKAIQTWPYYGIPDNPAAWIMQVSRNRALDIVRREKIFRNKESSISFFIDITSKRGRGQESVQFEKEIKDNTLWMMFLCCHPSIPEESQISLALRTLCGFSTGEIANSFLTSEAAISKRITRAKQKIREADISFRLPTGNVLKDRTDGVLKTLYLLFNEGYKSSGGNTLIRYDLCSEAIRLCEILADHPAGERSKSQALLSLMLLSGSRIPARIDGKGNILRLREQDRSLWDQTMIARGLFHLMRSTEEDEITEYHIQAGIAAAHCSARDYESTDWERILRFYDMLLEMDSSPVIALNRAVVIANIHGPKAGIEAIQSIDNLKQLESYYLLYAVLGEFQEMLDNRKSAAEYFNRSLELVSTKSEKKFFRQRLEVLE